MIFVCYFLNLCFSNATHKDKIIQKNDNTEYNAIAKKMDLKINSNLNENAEIKGKIVATENKSCKKKRKSRTCSCTIL